MRAKASNPIEQQMCHVRVKSDPMSRGSEGRGLDALVGTLFYLTQRKSVVCILWGTLKAHAAEITEKGK